MNIYRVNAEEKNIHKAAQRILQGDLVAIPTETVYGLAGDASNASAIAKIFAYKDRPTNHPLIVHLAPPMDTHSDQAWIEVLSPWAREIPEAALTLAKAFWPGPLTMIFPKAKGVLDEVTGGQASVGIRCPSHVVPLELLKVLGPGAGLAAPSANRFGRISPTEAAHVIQEFADLASSFDLVVIDGGPCAIGIESTIIDLTNASTDGLVLLRPGMISLEDIAQACGVSVTATSKTTLRFSGGMSAHYAPRTLLRLVPLLNAENDSSKRQACIGFGTRNPMHENYFALPFDPAGAARELYRVLRLVDSLAFDEILFENIPTEPAWDGIRDRVMRAAKGSGE